MSGSNDSADEHSGYSDVEEVGDMSPKQAQLKKTQSYVPKPTTFGESVVEPQPNQWKAKVRTELCKFWLRGLPCDNRDKEQGCGFAHGEHELQPKQNLNK